MALIFRDEAIENNFTKLTFTKAECKECKVQGIPRNTFTHTSIEDFRAHIQTHENIVKYIVKIEEQQRSKAWWKFIRSNRRESEYHCILCKEDFEIESLESFPENHIHDTDEYSLEGNCYEEWQWKYCIMKEKDSEVECYICEKKVSINFRRNFLMYHLREYHNKLVPQNVRNISRIIMSEEISKNYVSFSNQKAECITCNRMKVHTTMTNFFSHIRNHENIAKAEEQKRSILSWRYLKYCKNGKFQCVLCEAEVTNENDCDHIHAHDNFTSMGKNYDQWELKYGTRIGNTYIECDYCESKINSNFLPMSLKRHTESCMNKNSLNNKKKVILEKYFEKSSRYFSKVKCKLCDLEVPYVSSSVISSHILMKHTHILDFEDQNHPFEKSCRNLKYVNELLYKCDICHQQVSSDKAALLNHRCKDENNIVASDESWFWKYCIRSNEFRIKCAVCSEMFDIDFFTEELKHHMQFQHKLDITNELQ